MSLLYDFARDYQAALVGFGQVFAASALLVGIFYWLKMRLMKKLGWQSRSRPKRQSARRVRSKAAGRIGSKAAAKATRPSKAAPQEFLAPSASQWVPPRISPEAHSQRAAALIHEVVARGERARELHQRSLVRLEAADYAFQRLLLEVAEVINLPQAQEVGDSPRPAELILPEQVRPLAA